jgi:hypothetical protein
LDEACGTFGGYKKFTEKFKTSIGMKETVYYTRIVYVDVDWIYLSQSSNQWYVL